MEWLSGTGHSFCQLFFHDNKYPSSTSSPSTIGILSFETARIISRLVSLYRSLSDDEIHHLRTHIMRSKGVAYLNSRDEHYLLSLAGAERFEDLNLAAEGVSRLGRKCSDHGLFRFDLLYSNLKHGDIDTRRFEFGSKGTQKVVEKMEKFVTLTANLYAASESLTELEHSERKINRWKKNLDAKHFGKTNFELFHQKVGYLRKEIQHYREISLWSQSFDKIVGFMARTVCVVFARIITVFGPYISGPHSHCLLEDRKSHLNLQHENKHRKWGSKSCPASHECSKKGLISWFPWRKHHHHHHYHHHHHHHHHHHRTYHHEDSTSWGDDHHDNVTGGEIGTSNTVFGLAPPSTVGGSALTVRYANVILTAESFMHAPDTVNNDMREGLYDMLPGKLKMMVRSKLRSHWVKKKEELAEGCDGHALALGWKDALEEIMTWLGPVAHDTMTWQAERNLERQKYLEGRKPTVLLLQTLHFADLEKTEAAIVEVLVGLSCVYNYENNRRRSTSTDMNHNHNFNHGQQHWRR